MMERRMKRKFHVRCEAGENLEITSKSYLSLYPGIENCIHHSEQIAAHLALSGQYDAEHTGEGHGNAQGVVTPVYGQGRDDGAGSCQPYNLPGLPA